MNVRAHLSMLLHLDKCIGCHTCSVACKNLWTDRKGAEYMWWNNGETRPGVGYPMCWEDQSTQKGGWEKKNGNLKLRLHTKAGGLANLFFNPALPSLDDYYEPFTFRYLDLFNAPAGDDQPTAIPLSMITGEPIEVENGPNWDDDLGGSNIYARNDPSLMGVADETRAAMHETEGVVLNYLPRICNHCLNPACVAACPSGAIYKRAEDGVVLVNENKCRGWRMCVSACPYKKVYYNWTTGKSEKCILCFPRLETGQAPACAHSCVGRIRYMGVLLYDAEAILQAAQAADVDLVQAQREAILDPFDARVQEAALANGVTEDWIASAQQSPVYRFVKEWGLALPLHPEYRTLAMMFYIPPLSPVVSVIERDLVKLDVAGQGEGDGFELARRLEAARLPLKYLANLFAAGNEAPVRYALRKMMAVRSYKRRLSMENSLDEATLQLLTDAGTTPEEAEAIYRLTALAPLEERFVLPPYHRELAVETRGDPLVHKGEIGFGSLQTPQRGD